MGEAQKTIIITGASRGIGAATALMAAREGYAVCVNYRRNRDAAEGVVQQIASGGGRAIAIAANVANERDVAGMFDQVAGEFGPVGALVNNAGVLGTQSTFSGISVDRFRRILETNVIGAFICAKEAVRRMSRSNGGDGGSIVNVSSLAARSGAPFEYVDYAASKGALDSMTAGLAREVAPEGIRVNLVRPGFIYTGMHADGGEPGRVDRLVSTIPLQRGGEPDDVARAILWLVSDKATYAVGASIDVTGGV
ncbi:MAG: glucose 1-dehydrogenase [Proteobacteria bacterium]|nr:glucose 1-dehydrogenase [Pseudomonadota bacterium]MDA0993995.1 glucose 1-dehydrogenase [Pseudomonadota bacterium]